MLPLHHRDIGAPIRIRTADLHITNVLLYQLSYRGETYFTFLSIFGSSQTISFSTKAGKNFQPKLFQYL
jgi:hypothetical protein